MKTFYIMYGVGKSKYMVNYHDGVKTHKDKSPFYDMKFFKNKMMLNQFIESLINNGYKECRP